MFIGPTHKEDVATTQPHKPRQHITRGTGIRMADMRFIIDVINRGRDFIRPDAIIKRRGGGSHNFRLVPTIGPTLLGTRCGGRGEQQGGGGRGRDRVADEGRSTATGDRGASTTRRVRLRRKHHVAATATQGYRPPRQHKYQEGGSGGGDQWWSEHHAHDRWWWVGWRLSLFCVWFVFVVCVCYVLLLVASY